MEDCVNVKVEEVWALGRVRRLDEPFGELRVSNLLHGWMGHPSLPN